MTENSFLAALCLSLAGAALLYQILLRRRGLRGAIAWITLGLGLPAGFLCAKLGFLLSEVDRLFFGSFDTLWTDAISLSLSTFSFAGACVGLALAAFAAAKIMRRSAAEVLDVFAAPFCAAIAGVRLAESFLTAFNVGDVVEAPWLRFFPVAAPNSWGEWELTLWALCAVAALVCLGISLLPVWQRTGKGLCFECTAYLLCALQLLPELARVDPIKLSQYFVRTEQVICAGVMLFLLIRGCIAVRRRGVGGFRAVALPLILFAVCAGVHITMQFMLDKPYKFFGGLPQETQNWCYEHLMALCWIPMVLATAGMILLFLMQLRRRALLPEPALPAAPVSEPEEAARALPVPEEAVPEKEKKDKKSKKEKKSGKKGKKNKKK
ncbi:MAG: hypothetical protein IJK29_11655 [Bacteroidales bacterium]|nr:hypothetical protein [Bacteroidales bacterium]MBQ6177846.1 hypothetical protein [Bacteroidales bacterium]